VNATQTTRSFAAAGRWSCGLVLMAFTMIPACAVNAQIANPGIFSGALSGSQGTSSQNSGSLSQQGYGQGSVPSSNQNNGQANEQNGWRNAGQNPERQNNGQDRQLQNVVEVQQPPTDFQLMITATTGRQLPIFGASMFAGIVPSTFSPVDNVPVTPDYVIGPGDELRLQVWGQINEQGSFTVDRTGSIALPQLGAVHVAGLRFSQVTEFLRGQLGRIYRNFDLNVNLGQLRSIQIFVVGQARRPGSYTIGSMSTLLNALFASGGPTPQGSLRDIQVQRGGRTVSHFDLYDLLLRGDKSKDVALAPGDVIFIPPVGPSVALLGSVNTPAIYELRGETTAEQLIALGGGRTSAAGGGQLRLQRVFEQSMLTMIDVDKEQATSMPLQSGDMLAVGSIVDRFKDAVTLRGNVANPGRYVWHAGMKITDLIPNKDSLVTRNYWEKRNQLGQIPGDYTRTPQTALPQTILPGQTNPTTQGALQVRGNDAGPRRNPSTAGSGGSVGMALTGGTGVFTPANDVVLSAPDIDWSYAVVERMSKTDLTTSLIPFNLGRIILDGDSSQNVDLLAGDIVTIFSTADLKVPTSQQTRFVRLEGEFASSGVYSVRPGETLRQLLERAGGFSPDAYLYASEFTRESTRRVEQQRLSEYADQLEALVSTQTANGNATALTDRDAAAATASASDAQAAIARLRQVQPSGRIVLPLKPSSNSLSDIPDLALEDGDRFVVPRVPSGISVEGQVYSSNSFVYVSGRRVQDYLKEAGGPSRQADMKHTFVLRADGSVLSRQYGNLEHAMVFPGDTIVVPLRVDKRAVLRNLTDIATIVGQFGIGVAAINVLK
jgi:polysaccharide biosynthesis/export protein